jgi:hypothetical protein
MKNLLATLVLAGGVAWGAVSFGINIGPPPPPRVFAVPPSPGPGYVWVNGYWYPVNGRYVWHEGYWSRPPYDGARWVGPRHDGRMYYNGYWDGDRGRYEHDHRWDRGRDRDWHRGDRDRDDRRGDRDRDDRRR